MKMNHSPPKESSNVSQLATSLPACISKDVEEASETSSLEMREGFHLLVSMIQHEETRRKALQKADKGIRTSVKSNATWLRTVFVWRVSSLFITGIFDRIHQSKTLIPSNHRNDRWT